MNMKRHWKILAFLFTATVINYMDRQTLAVSSPLIQKDFSLSNEQLGLLFSAFYFSYAISVAIIGEFIDRVSIRTAFVWIVTWWSVATMLTGLSKTYWSLLVFRILLGIGEAGLFPATARLISRYMQPEEKTLANSFYMAGGSLGLVIVQPLMIGLSLAHGWRFGFFAIGAISSVWILAWLYWFRPSHEAAMQRVALPDTSAGLDWRSILSSARFWGFMLASFCGNTCLYFLMNWLPSFLIQDRHFRYNLKLGGTLLIPYLGLDTGYFVSGFIVLTLARRFSVFYVRRYCLIVSSALMSCALVLTPGARSGVVLVAVLFMTTFGMAVWNSNYLSGVEELSASKPAAVAGLIGSIGAFSGAISLWLIGLISQVTGSFSFVFFAAAVLMVIGSMGMLVTERMQGRDIPIAQELPQE